MIKSRGILAKNYQPLAEINVVPYIDVMLVLLIIFMITTPLLTQGVEVNLPQTKAKTIPAQSQMPLILTVDKQGQLFLNTASDSQTPLSPRQVEINATAAIRLAAQQNQALTVLVKGDEGANYGDVVAAMTLLQQAGARNIGLITKPIEQPEVS